MDVIVYDSGQAIVNSDNKRDNEEQEIKYLKENEVIRLITGIKSELHRMLSLFLFESASRISEALVVKIKDIDFYQGSVKLITLKQRKKAYRVLKISDKLKSEILLYMKELNLTNEDYLFTRKTETRHISMQAVNQQMTRYFKEILGSEYADRAHPHTFRHSRAIQLLNSGMNVIQLMRVLGHSHIRNTLIYLQYSNKDIAKTIQESNKTMGLY
ncbi:MAG TPA: hypothetical protein DCP90_09560 [Clostridiales bacterium]|nr:MAG: hypothetical protein A2Y22_08375 [Clostridiales bacterium GWD2_32_59]HAN10835.1 hypothetical protein [Clostridiales bacterium]